MLINILTFIALSLLITVLYFDLQRHLELRASRKRLERSFKDFMDAIDEHNEECDCEDNEEGQKVSVGIKVHKATPENLEKLSKDHDLKEVSIVKVPKKKGNFSKKLSADQIKEIAKAPFSITHRALAVKYGVSEGRIGQIRRGAKQAKKAK